MIGVDEYDRIRYLFAVEGMSRREIARRLGVSRNTVKKYCRGECLPGERKPAQRECKITGPIRDVVSEWLREDESAPKKQRHTARRVYDRLRKEYGFPGGQSTIRRLVREMRPKEKAYIPLEFDHGEAAQVDWGEATVIVAGEKRKAHIFCMRLCYSGAAFVTAFPNERTEAFLEGHKQAFEFFGGVTRRLIYDNLRTAVKKGWGRHVIEERPRFKLLKAHYAFRADYCNPGEAHEKGLVEGLVGLARRNALVPMPRADNWEEIQSLLLERCFEYLGHRIPGRDGTVGEMLREERASLVSLPLKPFDPAEEVEREVRPDGMVSFDRNWYCASPDLVGQVVTVKGSPTKVRVFHRGQELAVHERRYTEGKRYYGGCAPYLKILETHPRAVRNAAPVRQAGLPRELFAYCYRSDGPEGGSDLVAILRLMEANGCEAVNRAVHDALLAGERGVGSIRARLGETTEAGSDSPALCGFSVKDVNLGDYDLLLKGGGAA